MLKELIKCITKRTKIISLPHITNSIGSILPIKESSILTGPLEDTNEPYAIAKIAAIKLCHYYNQNKKTSYRCLMPTNIYGLNDNFDPNFGHVIPSLITKFKNSKSNNSEVIIWGDGKPKREFLHVNDLAEAV